MTGNMTQVFDAQLFKSRCSAIHAVMANSQSNPVLTPKQAEELLILREKVVLTDKMKERIAELEVKEQNRSKIILSEGCISHLMEWYAWETKKMVSVEKELMDIPHMKKGNIVEQDSLDLLAVVDGVAYKSNINEDGEQERVSNDYLTGKIDAYVGESIMTASIIPDAKSLWDYPTFLSKTQSQVTKANDLQLKGYGSITGASELFVANCLITTPERIRFDMYNRLKYQLKQKMNPVTDESPDFVAALEYDWEILERSMIFDDIPAHQRVFKQKVQPMTQMEQILLYDRVKVCREWLSNFHETYQKLNK